MTDFLAALPEKIQRAIKGFDWTVIGPPYILDATYRTMLIPVRNLGVTNFALFDEDGDCAMVFTHEEIDSIKRFNHNEYPQRERED